MTIKTKKTNKYIIRKSSLDDFFAYKMLGKTEYYISGTYAHSIEACEDLLRSTISSTDGSTIVKELTL